MKVGDLVVPREHMCRAGHMAIVIERAEGFHAVKVKFFNNMDIRVFSPDQLEVISESR